jgi:hypothetical protein
MLYNFAGFEWDIGITDVLFIFFVLALPFALLILAVILGIRDIRDRKLRNETAIVIMLCLFAFALPALSGAF